MTPFTKVEEERHDNYQRKSYENIQHNQRRRMQLQSDFQSQQRNHRLSRAAWLQGRWLEISEQERRAKIHNQKLLQDFQRAQDTLNDMLARTEAMNNIRVQYEQYLEESFPQWQKRLKDIRVSEKSKRVQQHSRSYIQQMEEDEGMKRSDFRGHPLSSNSQNPSQTSHNTQNTQTAKDIHPNGHHLYFPPTWLTGSQPFLSGSTQYNIPKDYKNLQNIQALNHPLPPYYSIPGDSLHQSHSPVQQKALPMDHLRASIRQGCMPTANFTPAGASWPQLPVLSPMMWGMMDVPDPSDKRNQCSETDKENMTKETLTPNEESCQRLKHQRNGKESDRCELDSRPVRLSNDNEESSESSGVSPEVTISGMQKRGKKKRGGTKALFREKDNNSQSSSIMSQDASDGHSETNISKIHKKPFKKYRSKESIITTKNADAVMQDEGEDEQKESRSQEIVPSCVSLEKKDGSEGLNIREEEDFERNGDSHIEQEKICDREAEDEDEEEDKERTGVEEEAGLDDEAQRDDEEESEKVMGKRDGIEPSDREEPEEEGDLPEDIPDSEDGGETMEEEERENHFQDEKEARKTQGRVEDDKKRNTSDRDIHKSLEGLYANEAEEEEVYNQEIEDIDEVVVEKAYKRPFWSRDPFDDHTKCPDDEDEDIEGLLNPVISQTQKEDDVEEIDQANQQHSGSEVENLPLKNQSAAINESVESDDQFDHFYD